jgi:tellurite resistance protein TerC
VNIPTWLWTTALVGLVAVLVVDLVLVARRPHEPSLRESTLWVLFYIVLAVIFGLFVTFFDGPRYGGEFFAGWLTEYSLSVDNLFVFVVIMSRFAVPRKYQQKVLLIGIVLALIMRGAFIAIGAAAIEQFAWIFYLFGAFLIYTAINLVRHQHKGEDAAEEEFKENLLIRWTRKVIKVSGDFNGGRLRTTIDGKKIFTPMIVVMVAIGTTDLLFALDSIPAIFGLTTEPFLVFAANVFALMGLMQLYFLLGGLLKRLVYLGVGLSIILAFIGVKLILQALHENTLPFVNGGEPVPWAPEIPIWLSLGVILVTLAITTVASLWRSRRDVKAGREPRGARV